MVIRRTLGFDWKSQEYYEKGGLFMKVDFNMSLRIKEMVF
jgi:hypothetical protein